MGKVLLKVVLNTHPPNFKNIFLKLINKIYFIFVTFINFKNIFLKLGGKYIFLGDRFDSFTVLLQLQC